MPTILHVFEPRYRLMIRRCIESSSPRFGMVLPARGTGASGIQGVMECGTMLEIQSVQMLPDGRSLVETVGTHRFKLLEKGNLDGYTVGRIERRVENSPPTTLVSTGKIDADVNRIDDISAEEEILMERTMSRVSSRSTASDNPGPTTRSRSPADATDTIYVPGAPGCLPIPGAPVLPTATSPDDSLKSTEEYMTICRAFIDQLRSGSAPWLLQRLNHTYGTMPDDPSEFSYWMALVMPIDEYEKARLLPIRSARLRLRLIVYWVESLRSSWW